MPLAPPSDDTIRILLLLEAIRTYLACLNSVGQEMGDHQAHFDHAQKLSDKALANIS